MSQFSKIWKSDAKSGKNHKSIIARLGSLGQKYTDPLAMVFGKKYTRALEKIADKSNAGLSKVIKPFDKVDQAINPVRRYVPGVDKLGTWITNKPVDSLAIAAGTLGAGSALGLGGAAAPTTGVTNAGGLGGAGLGGGSAVPAGGANLGGASLGYSPTASGAPMGGAPASSWFNPKNFGKNGPQQQQQTPDYSRKPHAQLWLDPNDPFAQQRAMQAAALRGTYSPVG